MVDLYSATERVWVFESVMSALPAASTPLYNHPLHHIEMWLETQGCVRSETSQSTWLCDREPWQAVVTLGETQLQVVYNYPDGSHKSLSLPYSLSREDMELAVFGD